MEKRELYLFRHKDTPKRVIETTALSFRHQLKVTTDRIAVYLLYGLY
jgi:hypothetical protein